MDQSSNPFNLSHHKSPKRLLTKYAQKLNPKEGNVVKHNQGGEIRRFDQRSIIKFIKSQSRSCKIIENTKSLRERDQEENDPR